MAAHKGPGACVPQLPLSSHIGLSLFPVSLHTFRHSLSGCPENLLRGLTLGSLLTTSVPSQATKQCIPPTTDQNTWQSGCIHVTLQPLLLSNSSSPTATRNTPPWNSTEVLILLILLTCSSKTSSLVPCSPTDWPSAHRQACAAVLRSDCTLREHMGTQH